MPEPWFASTLDSLTPLGAATVDALSLSTTTRGVAALVDSSRAASSPILPLRASGSAGFIFLSQNVSNAWGVSVSYVGAGGADRFRFIRTGSPDLHALQYWDGATWVTVGTSFTVPGASTYQARIEWSGYGTTNGAISLRVFNEAGEAPLATRSATGLDLSGQDGVVQAIFSGAGTGQGMRYGAMFVCDDNGDSSYVYTAVANQNGADAGGTGSFSSVNSTGSTYDSTFISLPTAGLRRSIKSSANRNYDSRTIRGVAINARLRRGATGPTRAAIYLTIGGTRYFHPNVQLLTTSFQSYSFVWETNPATSAAWTTAEAEAASMEWGVEARA